jgi:hypothetical protein
MRVNKQMQKNAKYNILKRVEVLPVPLLSEDLQHLHLHETIMLRRTGEFMKKHMHRF